MTSYNYVHQGAPHHPTVIYFFNLTIISSQHRDNTTSNDLFLVFTEQIFKYIYDFNRNDKFRQ